MSLDHGDHRSALRLRGSHPQIREFHSVNEGDPWCQSFRKKWCRIFRNPHTEHDRTLLSARYDARGRLIVDADAVDELALSLGGEASPRQLEGAQPRPLGTQGKARQARLEVGVTERCLRNARDAVRESPHETWAYRAGPLERSLLRISTRGLPFKRRIDLP